MRKLFFIFIIAAIGILALMIILANGDFRSFLNIPTFIVSFVLPYILLLTHFRFSEIKKAFAVAGEKSQATLIETKNAQLVFRTMRDLIWYASVLGVFVGIVVMLANLTDQSALISGLAVALICIVYSFALNLIITIPYISALQKKVNIIENR